MSKIVNHLIVNKSLILNNWMANNTYYAQYILFLVPEIYFNKRKPIFCTFEMILTKFFEDICSYDSLKWNHRLAKYVCKVLSDQLDWQTLYILSWDSWRFGLMVPSAKHYSPGCRWINLDSFMIILEGTGHKTVVKVSHMIACTYNF